MVCASGMRPSRTRRTAQSVSTGWSPQQENYRKSGFRLAHSNIRYGGVAGLSAPSDPGTTALADVALASVLVDDSTVFPARRSAFLQAWISAPGHVGRALMRDGRLCGWGVIRPCRVGWKIGPLVADDRASAEAVFAALWRRSAGRRAEVFLDVPSVNREAVALAPTMGWRRYSRPRACTPGRSIRSWNACSASPRSNWAEPSTVGAKHVTTHPKRLRGAGHPHADHMAARSHDVLLLLGRVLLGWIFVTSGWRKLMDIPGFAATMPRRGLPEFLGYVAPPVEFIGGLMILFGVATRYAALLILLFTIVATFSSHRYWDFTDAAQRQQQNSHFWKNVSMMGGQILLFLTGGGRYAFDRLLMRMKR